MSRAGQDAIRRGVSARLKAALDRELAGALAGSRPARLRVTVEEVEISPLLLRVVGGNHRIRADAVLLDARTGAEVARFPAETVTARAGHGIRGTLIDAAFFAEPIARVTGNFAARLRTRLAGA